MNGKIRNAFLEVRADESVKKKTFEKIRTQKSKKHISIGIKLAPLMTVAVLFMFGNMYYTPVSYISIDINPSIELSINAFDRVIDITANNEDGEKIISDTNLSNLNYVEALEVLDDSESFGEYVNSYTEITVISDDSDDMIDNIEGCDFYNQNISLHSSNLELKEAALENNISFGKYRAYLELLEVNSNIEIEEVANMSMESIREMIENDGSLNEEVLPQGGGNPDGKGQNQGTGSGYQHGKDN